MNNKSNNKCALNEPRCWAIDCNCKHKESKVKTEELYAASDKEKESLIDWYKDHSSVELHDDGINTLCKICPPDEYGEDEDCEALQNIIQVMFYRITKLEARNMELGEALEDCVTFIKDNIATNWKGISIAEQAINNNKVNRNANIQ